MRLGGSAPPVLPCTLPGATVPETTDICRHCVGLRTQWCGWLGSWQLWKAARHVLVEVLIQGWRDHWQPETSTEDHDGCFMATKEKWFTSFLQLTLADKAQISVLRLKYLGTQTHVIFLLHFKHLFASIQEEPAGATASDLSCCSADSFACRFTNAVDPNASPGRGSYWCTANVYIHIMLYLKLKRKVRSGLF